MHSALTPHPPFLCACLPQPATGGREMGEAVADAAEAAYDRVADTETEQRLRTEGASSSGSTDTVAWASDSVLQQRTYFVPVLLAYIGGLGVAFAANTITHLGQPALLYLCPMTLGTVALVAASRGELSRVFSYTDTSAKPLGGEHKK